MSTQQQQRTKQKQWSDGFHTLKSQWLWKPERIHHEVRLLYHFFRQAIKSAQAMERSQ
jgi:hypothetical protein